MPNDRIHLRQTIIFLQNKFYGDSCGPNLILLIQSEKIHYRHVLNKDIGLLDLKQGMIYYHTGGDIMRALKIAITIDHILVKRLDNLVRAQVFPNRSKAIQKAVEEKLMRMEKSRLARECAKLDPKYEQTLAEEGFSKELEEWPEY